MSAKVVWLTTTGGSAKKYKYFEDGDVYKGDSRIGRANSLSDAIEIMKADLGESVKKVEVE